MRDFRDAKAMARSLRHGLTEHGLELTHSQCLELTARAFGYDNWNILAAKIEADGPAPAEAPPDAGQTLYCSFCGKSQHEVRTLIAGPSTFICNECVGLCTDITEHNEVLQIMAADDADGSADAGYPKLTAYLAGRSADQLRLYLGKVEREIARLREATAGVERAIEARAAGRPQPGPMKDRSEAQLGKQRATIDKQLSGSLRVAGIVTLLLEARG